MTNALARGGFTIGDDVRCDERKPCKKSLSVFSCFDFSLLRDWNGLRINFSV